MLEEWDPSVYQRHLAIIESGLQAAVTDALGDTRTAGRTAVAAYAAAHPERAAALTKRFDSSLQVSPACNMSRIEQLQYSMLGIPMAADRQFVWVQSSPMLALGQRWDCRLHSRRMASSQSKRKTSNANGQTNLGHKHKAPDHNHEATQPMVDLPHTS